MQQPQTLQRVTIQYRTAEEIEHSTGKVTTITQQAANAQDQLKMVSQDWIQQRTVEQVVITQVQLRTGQRKKLIQEKIYQLIMHVKIPQI